jgi:Predicted branched-chain amino acid permease (azaleucine resistance)
VETLTVGLGLIPLGLAFGLLMVQSGYAWWWTPIFSVVIYAGSMEFLAIGLVGAGVGPFSAALTGLMVNFRHIFYGLTFPRHRITGSVGRAYSTYAVTDESYAIVSARASDRGGMSGVRVLTIQVACQLLWVIPGIVGALVGQVLPDDLRGMEFALTSLFMVLAWEAFRANRDYSLPLTAGMLAVVSGFLAPQQMLIMSLSAYFIILALRYKFSGFDRRMEVRTP